jgi:hypothetical protein
MMLVAGSSIDDRTLPRPELMVTQPRGLLCGDAEESVAVQPVARQHAEPTRGSCSDGDVLFALWSAQGRVEDCSGGGFDHRGCRRIRGR